MFKFLSEHRQLIEARKVNAALRAQLAKNTSDIEYLAMMSDVDMDVDAEDGTMAEMNDTDEMEDVDDE